MRSPRLLAVCFSWSPRHRPGPQPRRGMRRHTGRQCPRSSTSTRGIVRASIGCRPSFRGRPPTTRSAGYVRQLVGDGSEPPEPRVGPSAPSGHPVAGERAR